MAAPRFKVIEYDLRSVYPRIYARRGAQSLALVQAYFGLSKAELGRIFGVSRQAIDEWRLKGVPPARMADAGRVADLARALHGRFLPERLPQIVREPLPGLDGRSVLRALGERGTAEIFELLDRAFAYASP